MVRNEKDRSVHRWMELMQSILAVTAPVRVYGVHLIGIGALGAESAAYAANAGGGSDGYG